jgi:hypothetical protein
MSKVLPTARISSAGHSGRAVIAAFHSKAKDDEIEGGHSSPSGRTIAARADGRGGWVIDEGSSQLSHL